MAKEQETKDVVTEKRDMGEVKIASDVVAVIAALAATEVDGVHSMAGNITNELIGRLGVKKISKGVKIFMEDGVVRVDMMVVVNYGYSIPDLSRQVQERVSQQIENMTGLSVSDVNVRVAGVNLED
jgi:uncharacterized alkaline shock family protein YloU